MKCKRTAKVPPFKIIIQNREYADHAAAQSEYYFLNGVSICIRYVYYYAESRGSVILAERRKNIWSFSLPHLMREQRKSEFSQTLSPPRQIKIFSGPIFVARNI